MMLRVVIFLKEATWLPSHPFTCSNVTFLKACAIVTIYRPAIDIPDLRASDPDDRGGSRDDASRHSFHYLPSHGLCSQRFGKVKDSDEIRGMLYRLKALQEFKATNPYACYRLGSIPLASGQDGLIFNKPGTKYHHTPNLFKSGINKP